MTYEKHDNDFIHFTATAKEAAALKAVYVKSSRTWKLPINYHALKLLQQLHPHPTISDLLAKEEAKHTQMKFLKEAPEPFSEDLRPYQAIDVQIIKRNPVLAIFNEQRTGKTPTVLSALKGVSGGLIVCPSSLKLNWQNEAKVWYDKPTEIVGGSKAKRLKLYSSSADTTLIISYETLRADIRDILHIFKRFSFLIVDEAHRLRNHKTKQSEAVYLVRNISDRVYPMTGTPAVNHPSDVYGILKLLYPTKYKSYWHFVERYFTVIDTPFGKDLRAIIPERKEEFHSLLYLNSIQRKRREVMKWVPKVNHRLIELEASKKQLSMFDEVLKRNTINDEVIDNPLTKLLRLKQICVDPSYLGVDEKSPKVAFIMDYIQDNDEVILIFSTMTQTLKRLHDAIPDSVLLTGEQSTGEKQWAVDQIQKGHARVLLSNIKAGGVGFTIDKADTIIFLDKSYTPDENDQASDRFIPTDPNAVYGAKQIISLVIKDSVEGKIEKLLKDKINIIKYVNDYGLNSLF